MDFPPGLFMGCNNAHFQVLSGCQKEQKKNQQLQEYYQEMNDYLLDLIREHNDTLEERRYMNDFIHYKNLDEEFRYFKEHAHEDTETELPFPYLVL